MKRALGLFFILLCGTVFLSAQEGLIPAFRLEPNELELQRLAQPLAPFDKIGHKFAILGFESGTFETWAYPLKLFRNFEFSFLTRNSTRPIAAKDIVRFISATPEATVLTFVHQSFTVRAIFLTPLEEAGALILLAVDSTEPLTIVCGFIPVLQPMWPAGLGGQYAYWDEKISAYILAESSRKNYGLVGSPAAEGISYTPAHMLADMPSEFKIEIKDPVAVSDKYIPIYMAGGKGKREEVIQTYQKIAANPFAFYRKNVEYFRSLQARTLRVTTPVQALNLALAWAKVSYDSLLVENPDVGTGLVAGWGSSGTGGRPGFGWFFGTDAYFNSLCLNAYGEFASSKKALLFTRKWQREDGKMAHELTQSAAYLNWFGDYGYAYIHGDTSPYYLCAAYDYYRMSGDRLFIQECWDSLKRAYLWSKGTDANGDGLMDNRQAGLGALEFGALAGIETDIYLAAVWTQAARAMQLLAETVGDVAFSHRAAADFQKARETLNDKFWNNPEGFFVYAFNNRGEQVGEITPWLATPLFWQLTDFAKGTASLQKLCGSEMATDWGVRSLSSKSHFYEPLNYNYGAVWPFLTGYVTTAMYKHHLGLQAYPLLLATARHTFDNALGAVTELFSGNQNIWPAEAVSHQGFSTGGLVLPLVRGLLGLEGSATNKEVEFCPSLPANWQEIKIENYRLADASFSFNFRRSNNRLELLVHSQGADGFRLRFAPCLAVGCEIERVLLEGVPLAFRLQKFPQEVQAVVAVPFKTPFFKLEIEFRPVTEVVAPIVESKTGDLNQGLKIVKLRKEDERLILDVEGLAGMTYQLKVTNPDSILAVEGAVLQGDTLLLRFPEGKGRDFLSQRLMIRVKKRL